jgi:mycothiol synthase
MGAERTHGGERLTPWKLQDKHVFMQRPHLREVPQPLLPPGYAEVEHTEDLLPQWVSLLDTVFGGYTIDKVRAENLQAAQWDVRRVKLVAHEGSLVALSMAWHEPALWPHSGFVFWLAVRPEHRRRGLGTFALCRALQHMADEPALRDAVLYTEEYRAPAISLYLKLGFLPLVTHTAPDEPERWQRALTALGRPELTAMIRDTYAHVADERIGNSRLSY